MDYNAPFLCTFSVFHCGNLYFFKLHFFHVPLVLCCTFFILQRFHVALFCVVIFSCCTFFRVALFLCIALFHVAFLLVAMFSFCILLLLQFFPVPLCSCCTVARGRIALLPGLTKALTIVAKLSIQDVYAVLATPLLFPCYAFSISHSFHVALFFMLRFFHVALFSCSTLFMLHFFNIEKC